MESKVSIIASCWIAIALISVVMIWAGGVNIWTNLAVGGLVLTAFIVTFGVMMIEGDDQRIRRYETPSGFTDLEKKVDDLTRIVESIKKTIEE